MRESMTQDTARAYLKTNIFFPPPTNMSVVRESSTFYTNRFILRLNCKVHALAHPTRNSLEAEDWSCVVR